jgi:hypothetical protein
MAKNSHLDHRILRVFFGENRFPHSAESRLAIPDRRLPSQSFIHSQRPEEGKEGTNDTCQPAQGVAGFVKPVGNGITLLISFKIKNK